MPVQMNAVDVKAECACYWRFIRQCPIVAVEALSEDLLIVSPAGRLIICEVKVSISDMRIDDRKPKHAAIRQELDLPLQSYQQAPYREKGNPGRMYPTAFYFAVPPELEEKAIAVREELYPYAGLIIVGRSRSNMLGHAVVVVVQPARLHTRKLTPHALAHVVKAQSASIANAYARISRHALYGME